MADTIRVSKSNLVVAETSAPAADGPLRITRAKLVIISGVTEVSLNLPAGRKNIVTT